MPKPTPLQMLIRFHRWRYLFDEREIVDQIIHLAPEVDAAEIVSQLPPDLLASVRRRLASLPTTDEGWRSVTTVFGGSHTEEIDQEACRARSRSAVEAMRRVLVHKPPDG